MTMQGTRKEKTFDNVKQFWDETANKGLPTIRDIYFQKLGTANIVDNVLLLFL